MSVEMNENSNILNTVKRAIGVLEDYTPFDMQILMHINSCFTILNQLGVGPKQLFIADSSSSWSDFLVGSSDKLELVKTYVFLKVKLLFDPPSNSFVQDSMQQQAQEYEWRLNVFVDPLLEEA